MHLRWHRGAAVFVLLGALAGRAAAGPLYTFTPISGPPGSSSFLVVGIDNAGDIVGAVTNPSTGASQSYLLSGGVYTSITVPGAAPNSTFASISLSGQIFGNFADASGQTHGFIETGSGFQQIDAPGAQFTQISALNSRGQATVTGFTSTSQNNYVYQNGTFTPLLPGTNSAPTGINNRGDIVGDVAIGFGVFQGFLLDKKGQFTPINDPNAGVIGSFVDGINSPGTIVGQYLDAQALGHGFTYQNGVYTTVDDPAGQYPLSSGTQLNGINDSGEIVGSYSDLLSGDNFSFLATANADAAVRLAAVPEPAGLTLVAIAGLTAAGWRLRKREACVKREV